MKYYIIAGERSGDLHGSNLIKAIKEKDPQAEIRCWGGDLMQQAGGELVVHYKEIAIMGFIEIIGSFRKILRYLNKCKVDIEAFKPDTVILIDYAGFNLKVAKYAHNKGYKVCYYISPKIWAWYTSRAKKIKALVDRMYVILPFEKAFYKQFDYDVTYVGNPVLDAIRAFQPIEGFHDKYELDDSKPLVALLPGSRKQEIKVMLPEMMQAARQLPQVEFAVSAVRNIDQHLYDVCDGIENVKLIFEDTYNILSNADAALVTSGTATLETAMFGVPEALLYKTMTKFSYYFVKSFVKVKFLGLVNLIEDQEVVRELIQDDMNADELKTEIEKMLFNKPYRQAIMNGYKSMYEKLGDKNASKNTAGHIYNYIAATK